MSCDLARAEMLRAVRARLVLDSLILTQVTPALFEQAGRLEPITLRTIDAVHLAPPRST